MSTPFFSQVFKPAIDEIGTFTGKPFGAESFSAQGSVEQLPKTTHLLILMIGLAVAKFENLRKEEARDAGRYLFGPGSGARPVAATQGT